MNTEASGSEVVRVRAVVSGTVQGVWFRHGTKEEAERLGLGGTVENLFDGTVAIEAEGPEERVEDLISWAHTGPDRAEVRDVTVQKLEPIGATAFEITGGAGTGGAVQPQQHA